MGMQYALIMMPSITVVVVISQVHNGSGHREYGLPRMRPVRIGRLSTTMLLRTTRQAKKVPLEKATATGWTQAWGLNVSGCSHHRQL